MHIDFLLDNFEKRSKKTYISYFRRTLFTTTQVTGAMKMNTTFLEGRLGLTHKKPSYRLTGTHPFPRSVLVWRSANRSTSLSSTSRPSLCTHWSLTANTAPPRWVVTRGRRWLVQMPPCSWTVTRKGSMLWVQIVSIPKQELVSLVTRKTTAPAVIPESDLVQEDSLISSTYVIGNEATHSPDNGNKHIKAMGYILVQC